MQACEPGLIPLYPCISARLPPPSLDFSQWTNLQLPGPSLRPSFALQGPVLSGLSSGVSSLRSLSLTGFRGSHAHQGAPINPEFIPLKMLLSHTVKLPWAATCFSIAARVPYSSVQGLDRHIGRNRQKKDTWRKRSILIYTCSIPGGSFILFLYAKEILNQPEREKF